MKNCFLIKVSRVILSVSAVLLITNCSKNNPADKNTQNNESQCISVDLEKSVLDFHENALNFLSGSATKSGGKISLDSALFYIDATINYVYCFSSTTYTELHIDTVYANFPIDQNDEVDYDDAVTAYNDAVGDIRTKYRSISDTSKKLKGIIVDDLGTDAADKRQLMIISLIGTGSYNSSMLDQNGDFTVDDEYWYREGSYRCDGTGEEGAPDVLEHEIFFKYKPAPPYGYRVTFTQIEHYKPDYYNFNMNETKDNYLDYRIYYASQQVATIDDITKCLEYDQGNSGIHEMDFYLDGAEYVLLDWINNSNPDSKSFESCFFDSEDLTTPVYNIKHKLHFWFGKKHMIKITIQNQNYPLPID